MSSKFSERNAVLARIAPVSLGTNATTKISSFVDCGKFGRIGGIAQISGALDVTATVKLYKAADSNGTSSATVATGSLATTSVTARDRVVNLANYEADKDNPYLAIEIGVGASSNTLLASAILLGSDPRFGPASDDNLANVSVIG